MPQLPTISVTLSGLGRLFGPGAGLGGLLELARRADALGIDQLVLPDHVLIGPRLDRYPFGRFPYPPEEPWLEPLTTLAAIAGTTSRIRLGTGVLVAGLRPAALLAKTVATLDVLSAGRVDLGVGVGWQAEEFEAVGVAFEARGRILDETIAACRALWGPQPVSWDGQDVSFADVWSEPRPVQGGGPPLWFGGGATTVTARRVAEWGAGWLPITGIGSDEFERGRDLIGAAWTAAGHPGAPGIRAGVAGGDLDVALGSLPDLAAAGVTVASFALGRYVTSADGIDAFLERLGERP